MNMMDAALSYVAEGFSVFPVKLDKKPLTEHGLKDATQLQIRVKDFWTQHPDASIGLLTDGLIVIDFDAKSGGKKSKEEIEVKYGKLPRTRTHRTGGGGLHYLYRNPNGSKVGNTVKLGGYVGVDLRANGGYIVVPPSPHPSGKKYEVLDAGDVMVAPDWIMELTKVKAIQILETNEQPLTAGQRNATFASLAGYMRKRGISQEALESALLTINQIQSNPPLSESEVRIIAKSIARYNPDGTLARKEPKGIVPL